MPFRKGVQYKKVIEGPWPIKVPKQGKKTFGYTVAVVLGCGHAAIVNINKPSTKPIKGPCLICTEAAQAKKDTTERKYTQRDLDRLVERKVQQALERLTGPVIATNNVPKPEGGLEAGRELKAVPE